VVRPLIVDFKVEMLKGVTWIHDDYKITLIETPEGNIISGNYDIRKAQKKFLQFYLYRDNSTGSGRALLVMMAATFNIQH
jgi:hypothetical protein